MPSAVLVDVGSLARFPPQPLQASVHEWTAALADPCQNDGQFSKASAPSIARLSSSTRSSPRKRAGLHEEKNSPCSERHQVARGHDELGDQIHLEIMEKASATRHHARFVLPKVQLAGMSTRCQASVLEVLAFHSLFSPNLGIQIRCSGVEGPRCPKAESDRCIFVLGAPTPWEVPSQA